MPPKPDPKDFIIENAKDVTVVRPPGSLMGYDFVVDTATNCRIELQDKTAQVQLDCLDSCDVYIGGCEGSVFLRDSKNVRLFGLAQQIRTRDCKDCSLYVACVDKPVIEACEGMKIGVLADLFSKRGEVGAHLQKVAAEIGVQALGNAAGKEVYDFSSSVEDGKQHFTLAGVPRAVFAAKEFIYFEKRSRVGKTEEEFRAEPAARKRRVPKAEKESEAPKAAENAEEGDVKKAEQKSGAERERSKPRKKAEKKTAAPAAAAGKKGEKAVAKPKTAATHKKSDVSSAPSANKGAAKKQRFPDTSFVVSTSFASKTFERFYDGQDEVIGFGPGTEGLARLCAEGTLPAGTVECATIVDGRRHISVLIWRRKAATAAAAGGKK